MSDRVNGTEGLLPETVRLLHQRAASIDAIRQGVGQVLEQLNPPLEDAISGLATVMVLLVQCCDDSKFPRQAEAVRGLASALAAFANAPDHASGCAAMVAEAAAQNRAVFERLDVDVATSTAPRN